MNAKYERCDERDDFEFAIVIILTCIGLSLLKLTWTVIITSEKAAIFFLSNLYPKQCIGYENGMSISYARAYSSSEKRGWAKITNWKCIAWSGIWTLYIPLRNQTR